MKSLLDFLKIFDDPQMLHAALAHLPIALVILGVPLLLWDVIRRPKSLTMNFILLLAYSAASGFAYWSVQVGEQAKAELPNILPAEVWNQVNLHADIAGRVWILCAVTAVTLLPTFLKQRARLRFAARTVALVMGLVTMLWTWRAGHEGGKLVYTYGVGTPALEIQTHRAEPTAADLTSTLQTEADGVTSHASSPSSPPTFATDVQPMFAAYCVSCHNPTDAKSGLDLTSLAGLLKGGEKAGPALLLDSPETSPFLRYVHGELQPRMPNNEPPLKAEQIALLTNWARDYAAKEIGEAPGLASSESSNPGTKARTAWSPRPLEIAPGFDSLLHTIDLRTRIRYDHLAKANAAAPIQPEYSTPDLQFVLDTQDRLNRYQRYRRILLVGPPPTIPAAHSEPGNPIDSFIYEAFQKANIVAPRLATDRDLIRRVFVDLLGVYPEYDDVERFVNDLSDDKYARLIDSLLQRRADYADNWIPQWADALSSGSDGIAEDRPRLRSDFRNWLAQSFKENRPLDEMVLDLFKAEPDAPTGRYVLSQTRDDSLMTAADIAQVFLGEAMRCASCHNHFKNPDLTLARTTSFASYFSESDHELIRCGKSTGQFLAPRPPFDLPEFEEDASGSLKERKEIAGLWLVDPTNERFAQVMANRIWKRYFGVGLYEPADDWSGEVQASHPELLRWLADDFRISGFNVDRIVKLILTSQTYQHAFDSNRATTFDYETPEAPRYFESPGVRRLTAEQYWDSVHKVLGYEWSDAKRTIRVDDPGAQAIAYAMGKSLVRSEAQTERRDDASSKQALLMLNDTTFNGLIVNSPAISAIVNNGQADLSFALRALYHQILSRDPSDDERRAAERYFVEIRDSADKAEIPSLKETFIHDTCWALLTSPEFLFVP